MFYSTFIAKKHIAVFTHTDTHTHTHTKRM